MVLIASPLTPLRLRTADFVPLRIQAARLLHFTSSKGLKDMIAPSDTLDFESDLLESRLIKDKATIEDEGRFLH